jgi:gamma-glutamylcyclotransferase (GGCT)/AIG2-like uncharacterized protein YtfP
MRTRFAYAAVSNRENFTVAGSRATGCVSILKVGQRAGPRRPIYWPDPAAQVWGVIYRISRRDLMRLDLTEGVPGRGYRHMTVTVEADDGQLLDAIAYIAEGKEDDGKPSLRYVTLLREGARAHGLPAHYIRFLESVEHGE